MIKLCIETQPDIIDKIKKNFVEDGDYTIEVMSKEFKNLMTNYPDSIIVIVAYKDDEIVGSLVACKCFNRSYVSLEQVYNNISSEFSIMAIDALKLWSKNIGAKSIRMECERDRVQFCAAKRYGFKEHGVVMELSI